MHLLSHFLDKNTPTYGNRDNLFIDEVSQISKGDSANSSSWNFSTNHIGTHIDAPSHFFEKGKTITDFKNSYWYSQKCYMIDIPCKNGILINFTKLFLDIPKDTEVLLIRTGYENYRNSEKYWNDNPGLSSELCNYLKDNFCTLRIVGFDFISLTSWNYRDEGKKAHRILLGSSNNRDSVCIIEDMHLADVTYDIHNLVIAPIFVESSNASPVTVFANIHEK
tara:strand:+ start:51 stop:716 length:666 start_codon:yes stop_codon:yes gene_type:complete